MLEIRFHGRGGQGAVFCANILAAAFFKEGNYVQAFPAFGMERRGAPVMAFLRVDEKPIRLRCQIYEPNIVVVLDPTLMEAVDPTHGLKKNGLILINSDRKAEEYGLPDSYRTVTFNASQIALQNRLGTPTMPIVNTAVAGAFARTTGLISIDSVTEAVSESAPLRTRENVNAAKQAYQAAEIQP